MVIGLLCKTVTYFTQNTKVKDVKEEVRKNSFQLLIHTHTQHTHYAGVFKKKKYKIVKYEWMSKVWYRFGQR